MMCAGRVEEWNFRENDGIKREREREREQTEDIYWLVTRFPTEGKEDLPSLQPSSW